MKIQILLTTIFLVFGVSIVSAQNAPQQISGGVVNGKAISLPVPEYPAAARAVGAAGSVKVEVVIDVNGDIVSANAVSGHPLLRSSSEKAARIAKFKPTLLAGQPVSVSGVIIYVFNKPGNAPNYEEQLKYMGLGGFVTISELIPPEEWEPFEKSEFSGTPELAADLDPLALITRKTSLTERAEIVSKVSVSVESKLKGTDAWQFRLGKLFGQTMIEIKRSIDENPDEKIIKAKLAQMLDLLAEAPPDFPPDIMRRFLEIGSYSDKPNFYSEENLLPFMELVNETLDIISPGE